jgi:orotidine-5'-phosphate decarboxylase
VLGLDPDPNALWPVRGGDGEREQATGDATATGSATGDASERAAAAVLAHCRAVIDATAPARVAVKLQLARFELLGPPGRAVLAQVAEHARAHGLLVIADGKRGDIDVTAAAYAAGLFGGTDSPFGWIDGLRADLVTVNPLMGVDALQPFVAAARDSGAGVLVLVRTSNPGAADVEDLSLEGGGAVWERVAAIVDTLGAAGVGEHGLSDVGAVLGATAPGHLARARELMPCATFLLPGVGAQGGRVDDLGAAFAPGRAGGLVAASRSIVGAYLAQQRGAGGEAPEDAARAEAQRLRERAWALSGA